ncbi:ribosome assembly cofactor RimP [Gordonia shandongensis]|uniref:ribosome assembly cofactor RimP n=1 Tax=Gordonia shandongensis TaxID=376351 RepID=UPI000554921C|nr:ribosome assembly cofactor RimP [Gordonia shandongensis]
MTGDSLTGEIGTIVEPVLTELGFDVEEIAVSSAAGGRRVRIVVDRDSGATLDDLSDVSRALDDVLDASDALGDEPYELELTTPGIDRPLTAERHWRRARGRRVTVTHTVDGEPRTVTARVGPLDSGAGGPEEAGDPGGAGEDGPRVTLVTADKGRIGSVVVPLSAVETATVQVDFSRPGAAELRACGLDDREIDLRRGTPSGG